MRLQEQEISAPVRDFVTPVETVVRVDQTIADALQLLRTRRIEQKVVYFYAVDADNRLQGVVSTRALLLSGPASKVGDVMSTVVVSLPETTTLGDAMELFAMHQLLALPVVDGENRLIGTVDVGVYVEEVFEMAEWNRRADLFQLIGLSLARTKSPWAAFRMRMPWLLCNIAGGIACAIIAAVFSNVLHNVLLLAMFIPLVLTLSESISMQSAMLSLQHLHTETTAWKRVLRRAAVEWQTAVGLGAASGILVALAAIFWPNGLHAAGVIGLSILASMVTAATVGTVVPVLLHKLRLDPKVAAGPVALSIADVTTTTLYLGLSTWWLL